MNSAHHPLSSPKDVLHLLVAYPKRWLLPAAAVAVAAAVYAVVGPVTWEASQAVIIRNDAANGGHGPGKFNQPEEMKTVQETILELVKSRGVLDAALREVGPPDGYTKPTTSWPDERDIDGFRKHVRLAPPKGAEFGKTEIFYLDVQDHDQLRSLALSRAICGQLQSRFQQLRDAKAQSMIDELVHAVQIAKDGLDESTVRLAAIEKQVGSDLGELRSLRDSASSDSALRRSVEEIRTQQRDNHTALSVSEELLTVLRAAQEDPGRLVAAPNRLFESQPSLKRLKDGLVDAQIRTATLQGNMSNEHPLVKSAKQAEEEISRQLHKELAVATRGVEVELRMNKDRQALLDEQLALTVRRQSGLAELRAAYANQVAENNNRAATLERAEQNLAEARAAHASAKAASLISLIDGPDTGVSPVTPARAMIVLFGLLGGLVAGFGVLLLTVPAAIHAPAIAASPTTASFVPATTMPPAALVPPVVADSVPMPLLRPAATSPRVSGTLTFKQALEKVACMSKV